MDGACHDVLDARQGVAEERRRIHVEQARAERGFRRPAPIADGERDDVAATRDGDRHELRRVVVSLDDRLVRGRFGERDVQMRLELVLVAEDETPRESLRVGGLQHGGQTDRLHRRASLVQRARRRELRLRHAMLGKLTPQGDLVAQKMRRLATGARQREVLGDGGDDGQRALVEGQDAGDGALPGEARDCRLVRELAHLEAEPKLLGTFGRRLSVATSSHQQHCSHGGRC